MKRAFKFILILFVFVIAFGVGFILTLQLAEYKPDEITVLDIENNYDDTSNNYIELGTSIKFLTFNIGYASLSETEDFVMDGGEKGRMDSQTEVQSNLEGISSILEREAADIYLLQEVDVDSSRSYEINQYVQFQELLGTSSVLAYNYRVIFVPFPLSFTQMMGKVNSGIATFSNYYASDASRVQLPGSFSWPLRLANLKRCILITRYPIDGSDKELVVINVHMSAYDDGSMRAEETAALQQIMKAETDSGNYVIVGGDFNQTLPGASTSIYNPETDTYTYEYFYNLLDPTFWQAPPIDSEWFGQNDFIFGVDITNPSCRLLNHPLDKENPSNNQYYVIDGFIVSSNITILDVETLDESFKYSDHNPVIMEVILNN